MPPMPAQQPVAAQPQAPVDNQVQSAMALQGASPGQQTAPQGQPGDGTDIESKIDQSLNSLDDKDKAFLSVMLTPETVHVVSILFGPQIGQMLSKYADQNTILVPVPRDQFMQHMQGQGQQMQSPDGSPDMGSPGGDSMEAAPQQVAPKGSSVPKIKAPKSK